MVEGKRVMTREELASELMSRVDDMTKIGPVFEFIESVLKLQNDMSRPVYIFEVDQDISEKDVAYIDDVMVQLGVACCLIPRKLMGYVGEVDSQSFGVRSIKADILGLREGVVIDGLGVRRELGRLQDEERLDGAGEGLHG